MQLSQDELNNIKNRIKSLLLHYTDLSTTSNKTSDDFIKINKYFEELISYHKIKDFDNLFFKYFNKYALYDEDTYMSDSDISDSDMSTNMSNPDSDN